LVLDTESAHRSAELAQQKSPLNSNLSQIPGVIITPLKNYTIVIRTEDGKDHVYVARPLVPERLDSYRWGQSATLVNE
jgi:hypothetical protein